MRTREEILAEISCLQRELDNLPSRGDIFVGPGGMTYLITDGDAIIDLTLGTYGRLSLFTRNDIDDGWKRIGKFEDLFAKVDTE